MTASMDYGTSIKHWSENSPMRRNMRKCNERQLSTTLKLLEQQKKTVERQLNGDLRIQRNIMKTRLARIRSGECSAHNNQKRVDFNKSFPLLRRRATFDSSQLGRSHTHVADERNGTPDESTACSGIENTSTDISTDDERRSTRRELMDAFKAGRDVSKGTTRSKSEPVISHTVLVNDNDLSGKKDEKEIVFRAVRFKELQP